MPKNGQPRKWRGPDARQLISALKATGIKNEDIGYSADNHIQVRCPDGVTVTIPSDLSAARTYANARKQLADHGVDIPARGGGGGRGNRFRTRQQAHHRRLGMITRWVPEETYALVTTRDRITWFISRPRLRPDVAEELAEGRFVTFTGTPVPDLHQRYPHANDVRPAEPPARGEKIA
jgi:hypothetical protein